MTYIKVNGILYPATISGRIADRDWDGREIKTIRLTATYAQVLALLSDDTAWSIVVENPAADEAGGQTTQQEEYDNSEFCISGAITDHRDGTCSICMGKWTDLEALILAEVSE